MKKKQVLIVGAGPTGLTAGVELQRRGVQAHVIERRDQASSFSRAVGIIPASLKLLEPSGVAAELIQQGVKYSSLRVFNKTSPLLYLALKPREVTYGYDFILGLAQDRTESVLHDKLIELGGMVHYNTEFRSLEDKGNHVRVILADGTAHTYDFVIGADGIHSSVREQIGGTFSGLDLPETWSIADVEAKGWPHANAFTLCLGEDAKIAVVAPMEPNRFRVISNTPNALETLPLPMHITHTHRAGEFKISIRQVDRYQKGNVFLAGDAAHCHSPVGGRGMNLGIADAAELAKRLSDGTQDGYGAIRHAAGKRIIIGSERVRKFVTSTSGFNRGFIKTILVATKYIPFLQNILIKNILYGK